MRNVSIIQVIPAQVISHISSFERQSQKLLAPQLLLLPSSSGTFDSNKGQILQTPHTHTHTRKHTHTERLAEQVQLNAHTLVYVRQCQRQLVQFEQTDMKLV